MIAVFFLCSAHGISIVHKKPFCMGEKCIFSYDNTGDHNFHSNSCCCLNIFCLLSLMLSFFYLRAPSPSICLSQLCPPISPSISAVRFFTPTNNFPFQSQLLKTPTHLTHPPTQCVNHPPCQGTHTNTKPAHTHIQSHHMKRPLHCNR